MFRGMTKLFLDHVSYECLEMLLRQAFELGHINNWLLFQVIFAELHYMHTYFGIIQVDYKTFFVSIH